MEEKHQISTLFSKEIMLAYFANKVNLNTYTNGQSLRLIPVLFLLLIRDSGA